MVAIVIAGLASVLAVLTSVWAVRADRRIQEALERAESALRAPPDVVTFQEALADQGEVLEALSARLDSQTLAIAEGIERVDRAERRVRATVGRAQKKLRDAGYYDDGLDAEAAQLRIFDGAGGDGSGVQHMPPAVEDRLEAPAGIPGSWTEDDLRALAARRSG